MYKRERLLFFLPKKPFDHSAAKVFAVCKSKDKFLAKGKGEVEDAEGSKEEKILLQILVQFVGQLC